MAKYSVPLNVHLNFEPIIKELEELLAVIKEIQNKIEGDEKDCS